MKKLLSTITILSAFMACISFATFSYADEVEPINIESQNISLSFTSRVYNAEKQLPTVEVKDEEENIIDAENYSVSYSDENSTNVGKYSLTVKGLEEKGYSGEKTFDYSITEKSLKDTDVSITLEYSKTTYTGKALSPKIKVTVFNKNLTQGTDFNVSYYNNNKCGTATAKIIGIGNYKDTVKKDYNLNIAKVTGVSTSSRTYDSVKISWKRVYGVKGYKIYKYEAKSDSYKYYKTVDGEKNTSLNVPSLAHGTIYKFKVRAYYVNSGETINGPYSDIHVSYTNVDQVKIYSVTKGDSSTQMTIKWGKVKCSGYEIAYAPNKEMKGEKFLWVSGSDNVSKKVSSLQKKSYYVRVRAYKKIDKSTVYGKWSSQGNSVYSNTYASYTTNYVNNADRTTNLMIACKAINGTVIKPGQTFSFNKVVGERTAKKGYKKAIIFAGAGGSSMGLGGGICQVASTMFNCALKANVGIVERHQHSQRVSYVPLGMDAAIYWKSEDLKWKNTTKYPIKIVMSCKDGKISCTFKICEDKTPPNVSLKVTKSGKNFTLKRYVGGKCNYTAKSKY